MSIPKTKIFVSLFTLAALSGAFYGVVRAEEGKKAAKVEQQLKDFMAQKANADQARLDYLKQVNDQRENFRKQMTEAEQQYQQLLADQKTAVAAHTSLVAQTAVVAMAPAGKSSSLKSPSSSSSKSSSAPPVVTVSTPPPTVTKTKTS